jgi:hypothetical protein
MACSHHHYSDYSPASQSSTVEDPLSRWPARRLIGDGASDVRHATECGGGASRTWGTWRWGTGLGESGGTPSLHEVRMALLRGVIFA